MADYEDMGFAKLDVAREERTGHPEVVFGQGKTAEQIRLIAARIVALHGRALVTRAAPEAAALVKGDYPDAHVDPLSGTIVIGRHSSELPGTVLVLCAGTSDIPVAEEAALTAEWIGCRVERVYDVGVAGLDRLLAHREQLRRASVLIVVAGMEGALPSVVAGLVRRPVIAVPTSVGYGAHFQGLTPLLAMLTSCAAGISVVNIDNGFGAGYNAGTILRLAAEALADEKALL